MTLVNLTPHPVTVGEKTYAPSGRVARVASTELPGGDIDGSPAVERRWGTPEIPLEGGEIGIVSSLVLEHAPEALRGRLVAPDTGSTAVRNERGQILRATRWIIF